MSVIVMRSKEVCAGFPALPGMLVLNISKEKLYEKTIYESINCTISSSY